MNTYPAVLACARAILAGRVLLGGGVSVGEGAVLDWRRGGRGRQVTTPESAACPDAFDLAQAHFSSDTDEAQALTQARGLLLDTLAKEGLERIDEVGVAFDPQVHDAVAHVNDGEGDEGQVVDEVLRAGYRWKGAVLRPAMVRVKG